jgi:hypothetical protein
MSNKISEETPLDTITDNFHGFVDFELCDTDMVKKFQLLKVNQMEDILNSNCDQNNISAFNTKLSVFKIDFETGKPEHFIDVDNHEMQNQQRNIFSTFIESYDDNLVMSIMTPESFGLYLTDKKNQGKKYIFYPMSFWDSSIRNGHQVALVIDTVKKQVYLFDPNGRSSFFNHTKLYQYVNVTSDSDNKQENKQEIKEYDFSKIDRELYDQLYQYNDRLIDKLLSFYCEQISKVVGVKYTFIPSTIWNPYRLNFNMSHKNSIVGRGHCVIITIMILHYLYLTQYNLKDVIKSFEKLSDEEIVLVIGSYTKKIHDLFLIKTK